MATENQPLPPQSNVESPFDAPFLLLLAMVFVGMAGIFIGLFSLTYIQDLQTLRNVPDILWDFTCGRPNAAGATLPFMLTLTIISFVSVGVMHGIRRWLLRKDMKNKAQSDN